MRPRSSFIALFVIAAILAYLTAAEVRFWLTIFVGYAGVTLLAVVWCLTCRRLNWEHWAPHFFFLGPMVAIALCLGVFEADKNPTVLRVNPVPLVAFAFLIALAVARFWLLWGRLPWVPPDPGH
jgi:hypothetical protein